MIIIIIIVIADNPNSTKDSPALRIALMHQNKDSRTSLKEQRKTLITAAIISTDNISRNRIATKIGNRNRTKK